MKKISIYSEKKKKKSLTLAFDGLGVEHREITGVRYYAYATELPINLKKTKNKTKNEIY